MFKLLRLNYNPLETFPHAAGVFSCVANFSSDISAPSKITIPQRKPRSSTDILQTLSSTISRDPTAAHYKYHDDPFLIPMSNVGKRTFAMAQEAGRKAAKWIVDENPTLFSHKLAEPPIEVFTPKIVYNEKSPVEEDTLLNVINGGNVGDALIIYDLLKQKGVEISGDAKQALLELVSFSNEEDSVPEELIEERWFSSGSRTKNTDVVVKTWKDNGVAETLFKSLEAPTPAAYSALIQGMAKYGQIEKAWQHYEVTREKGMVLDVGVYNALLGVVNVLKQGPEFRGQLLQELLGRMAAEKIQPNISTLNAVLLTVSGIGGSGAVSQALSCIAEFRLLGIEPSLGSYYLLLQTLGRDRSSKVNEGKVVADILERVEGRNWAIQHPRDTRFFVKMMEVCRFGAQDSTLAHRLDDVLHTGDNYNLIGDSYEESVYYRHFFMLLCNTESMENIMITYNLLTPNVYTPEPSVMQELIKVADVSGALEQLPRFWTDMVAFDHANREPLLTQLLDALVRNDPGRGSPLVGTFADIATQVWEKVENQPANRVNTISWSGEMLSNVLIVAGRNADMEMAAKVMKKLRTEQSYLGEPQIEALCVYMDLCIAQSDFQKALDCLSHCKETGRAELATMAADLRSRLSLTDDQAQELSQLLADP